MIIAQFAKKKKKNQNKNNNNNNMASRDLSQLTNQVPFPRYSKQDQGADYKQWISLGKPLLWSPLYFSERMIDNITYSPITSNGVVVNNFSSNEICFAVWKLMAINSEQLPNKINYVTYCWKTMPFLKGDLAPYDCSSAAYVNEHIRAFIDVTGDSFNQKSQKNGLVKATNTSNTVDFKQGYGYAHIHRVDNGSSSVLPSVETELVSDQSLMPGEIVLHKGDSATNLSFNVTLTQAGIELPTKLKTVDAGMQTYAVRHLPQFLFAVVKIDQPESLFIASKIYEFDLTQAIVVTDNEQDPSSIDINVVSKQGCTNYFV